jgi:hypothetical protein
MESHLRSVPAARAEVANRVPSFRGILRSDFRRILAALCLVTGNRHEAEEIAQDACLRVFKRWDRVRAFDDPTGYLYRASMNVFRTDTGELLWPFAARFARPGGDRRSSGRRDARRGCPTAPRVGPSAAGLPSSSLPSLTTQRTR